MSKLVIAPPHPADVLYRAAAGFLVQRPEVILLAHLPRDRGWVWTNLSELGMVGHSGLELIAKQGALAKDR